MTRTKAILLVTIVLVFAAGVSLGMLIGRSLQSPPAPPMSSQLSELKLTGGQQAQIAKVLDEMRASFQRLGEKQRAMSKERTEAVHALLSDDQRAKIDAIGQDYSRNVDKAAQDRDQAVLAMLPDAQRSQYEAILKKYAQGAEQLSQERRQASDSLIEQTRKILTPEQAAKYDEMLKSRRERGQGQAGGFEGPRHHRRPTSGSKPTTDERPTTHGVE